LQESLMITLLDTLIALLACLMIFPITFSYGQETAGPGLVFMSMPLAFAEIGLKSDCRLSGFRTILRNSIFPAFTLCAKFV